MEQVDYLIAGAGAGGLTLAYLLMASKDTKKTLLIIDKDEKAVNDRTWCFWEEGDNLFEDLVYKSWSKAKFAGSGYQETFDISPYSYKLIRGIDFYNYMRETLLGDHRVTWLTDEIEDIHTDGHVNTKSGEYWGKLVFDSTFKLGTLDSKKSTVLLQHFKGYVIKTKTPAFKPEEFTYMDFTVPQEGDCRFGYVLPFNEHTALVEYTLFNEQLLDKATYEERLTSYIAKLGITNYQIIEEEHGVIPMTDHTFEMRKSPNVINIGINGGFAKPSTGYTFLRGQKILTQIAKNIEEGKDALSDLPFQKSRFKKYDATLLNVLASGKHTGDEVFTPMFKKNGAKPFFKFLDEETSLKEELKIMSSTPLLDFGAAFIKSMLK